jgi:hypothetical protein
VKAFYTSRAARIVILKQLDVVDHMQQLGALSDKSAQLIYSSIEDDNIQVAKERDTIHKYDFELFVLSYLTKFTPHTNEFM